MEGRRVGRTGSVRRAGGITISADRAGPPYLMQRDQPAIWII